MRINGAINSTQTLINVSGLDLSSFPGYNNFDIIVDNEILRVIAVTGSGFRVVRGSKGTLATSHADQAVVHNPLTYKNEPLSLLTNSGQKIFLGDNLSIANNVLSTSGGSGNGDLSSTGSYANPTWITSLAASKLTGSIVATNGVITTGSYSDPTWITSLAASKLTGSIVATNGVITTGSYSDPTWLTSLAASKLTGSIVATNGVITTGSYSDPAWITALDWSKISNRLYRPLTFVLPTVSVATDLTNWLVINKSSTIRSAYATAKTGPVGSDLVFDILKSSNNGSSFSTIWSTTNNRLKIVDGSKVGSQTTFDVTSLSANDLIRIDCVQIGSTTAGQNITVTLFVD